MTYYKRINKIFDFWSCKFRTSMLLLAIHVYYRTITAKLSTIIFFCAVIQTLYGFYVQNYTNISSITKPHNNCNSELEFTVCNQMKACTIFYWRFFVLFTFQIINFFNFILQCQSIFLSIIVKICFQGGFSSSRFRCAKCNILLFQACVLNLKKKTFVGLTVPFKALSMGCRALFAPLFGAALYLIWLFIVKHIKKD